jgi:NAD-dependent SIR2 family protein deacetylase
VLWCGAWLRRHSSYRSAEIHDGYRILLQLAAQKDIFCFTSNVDGVLQRAGFDPNRVTETHGQIHRLQCTLGYKCPSKQEAWEGTVDMEWDKGTHRATSPVEKMPRCPGCGGLARPVKNSVSFVFSACFLFL